MKNKFIQHTVLPLLAAMIWGAAFSFQKIAAEAVEPITFNACRSVIATAVLSLGLWLFRKWQASRRKRSGMTEEETASAGLRDPFYRKKLLQGGFACGSFLALASILQQAGIQTTGAGKASFITALYVVLVPVFAMLFFRQKTRAGVWFGVILAVFGLYFISVTEAFTVTGGDVLVFLCSLCFAGQILAIDRFSRYVNGVELSCAQFAFASLWEVLLGVFLEHTSFAAILSVIWPILYVAVLSSAVAYTLQIVAQKGGEAPVVTLLLSLESVFGALFAVLFLREKFTQREIIGCLLMLAAVVLAEMPERKHHEKKKQ